MKKHSFSEKLTKFMNGRGFYIALALCVVIIALSCWYLWKQALLAGEMIAQTSAAQPVSVEPEAEQSAPSPAPAWDEAPPVAADPADASDVPQEEEAPGDVSAQDTLLTQEAPSDDIMSEAAALEPMEEPAAVATVEPVEEAAAPVEVTEEAAPADAVEELPLPEETAADPDAWLWPLDGPVVNAFSAEELTYNQALGDWRTHDGLDLSAQVGQMVFSAHGGTVLSVKDDVLLGHTVSVDCGDGVTALYANLAEEAAVRAGDRLAAGDPIGTVGETAAGEQSDGPWLHFSLTCDGQALDPMPFFRQD